MTWQTGAPPDNGLYLVTTKLYDTDPYYDVWPAEWDNGRWIRGDNADVETDATKVLAWMPMPEPYREG